MKWLIMLTLVCAPAAAHAYPCPSIVNRDADAKLLRDWLSRFAGKFQMRGCEVEILACDPSQIDDHSLLGELYVVDAEKREAYIPITFVKDQPAKLKAVVDDSKRIIYYMEVDRFYEPEFGKTEIYRLEMRTDKATGQLRRLDIGTYSTNKALHQPNGNQSRWYNCGDRK